jgi:hypothetical protein
MSVCTVYYSEYTVFETFGTASSFVPTGLIGYGEIKNVDP